MSLHRYKPHIQSNVSRIIFFQLVGVFNLYISSTPLRLCPFISDTTGTIMSNADDFQDRPVETGFKPVSTGLSPSHTTRISVFFPYTLLLGNSFPRCKSSLGHMGYPSPFSRGRVFPSWCMFKRITQKWFYLIDFSISDKNVACASLRKGSWHEITRHTHTPQKVICTSSLRHITSRQYAVFLHIQITPLYMHRYKLLYED